MNSSKRILLAVLCQSEFVLTSRSDASENGVGFLLENNRAECVPLERRSNLDIYRKLSLFVFADFRWTWFPVICMNLRGRVGVHSETAWPISGHLIRSSCEIGPPTIFAFLPPLLHVFPPSSPPLSSTISSLFLACFSTGGVTWRSLTDSVNGYLI